MTLQPCSRRGCTNEQFTWMGPFCSPRCAAVANALTPKDVKDLMPSPLTQALPALPDTVNMVPAPFAPADAEKLGGDIPTGPSIPARPYMPAVATIYVGWLVRTIRRWAR